jgi:hypothetical protein
MAGRWRRTADAADAVVAGALLGLMGRRQLRMLDRFRYDRDSLYRGEAHNLRGLFDWEREAWEAHFSGCRSLAVIGAGGGREVLALSRLGHEVHGFECSDRLVRFASAFLEAQRCPARVRPLARDAPPPSGFSYDGVVVGWSAYMLIPGSMRRIAFLRGTAEVLPPGAPLLASFFTRSAGGERWRRIARVGNVVRRWRGGEAVEEGDDLVPNYVHRFTEDEVRAEMAESGFELLRFAPEGPGRYDSGWAVGRRE